jgi:resuscitation-promoting factor RpfB
MQFRNPGRYLLSGQALAWVLVVMVGCTAAPSTNEMLVSVRADGRERTFAYESPVTVGEFLRDAAVDLNELDRVNPEPFAQITDGMIVTVTRVTETTECEQEELAYRQQTVLNEGLAPGDERIGQAGQNGVERVCYRVRVENEVPQAPIEISRVVITPPVDEVVYVGPSGEIDPIAIDGTLAYLSNRNVWVMRGSSTNKRPVTTSADLDGFAFDVADDGRRVLFTRENPDNPEAAFANTLWVLADIREEAPEPVQLVAQDVLQAAWIPNLPNTISYSTAESSETAPGWRAFNDLWAMRLDPRTGEALRVEQIVEASSFGLYSWWGTQFYWSPDGEQLGWVRADSVGLVDIETGDFETLIEYPVFNTRQSWSWRATLSWSPANDLMATTVHVPIGNYPPETSPAFSAAVVALDGSFDTPIADYTGIWSNPSYSTLVSAGDTSGGYLAYMRARDPFNSINGEYDLVVADRDGSNARVVFPQQAGAAGLTSQEYDWSPDGRQIALIYQGNLWVLDVETGASHQLTLDGGASQPIWEQ